MKIAPDNELLQYSGRIDFEVQTAPVFVYAGSFVKIKFRGACISADISNHRSYATNYLGYILDGKQGKFALTQDDKPHTYTLGKRLTEGEHELLLFKRMDSCHYFTFHGFVMEEEGEILPLQDKPQRRIEVFGDSVSCGEVSEALHYVGKEDPKHDGEFSNSWYSYSWITARKLNAELHITAQGGAALMDKTGWFLGPDYIGMESIYDKIEYNPSIGPTKQWNFELWKPHVVIVAIGQNDANPENFMAEDYHCEKAVIWRHHYRAFVEKLMKLYPKAHFILATTILGHDASWDKAIDDVCNELNDARVQHFLYSNNGCGTPGHIRVPEAEKMAEELSTYINSLGDIWNEKE